MDLIQPTPITSGALGAAWDMLGGGSVDSPRYALAQGAAGVIATYGDVESAHMLLLLGTAGDSLLTTAQRDRGRADQCLAAMLDPRNNPRGALAKDSPTDPRLVRQLAVSARQEAWYATIRRAADGRL